MKNIKFKYPYLFIFVVNHKFLSVFLVYLEYKQILTGL